MKTRCKYILVIILLTSTPISYPVPTLLALDTLHMCDDQPKPTVVEDCGREFKPRLACTCLYTKSYSQEEVGQGLKAGTFNPQVSTCLWTTGCYHVTEKVGYDVTLANKQGTGGKAYTTAFVEAERLKIENRR